LSLKSELSTRPWQWRKKFAIGAGPQPFTTPVFVSDTEVLVATLGGGVGLYRLRDGMEKWKIESAWGVGAQPLVHEGFVYVASLDSKVFKLKLSTGEVVWESRFAAEAWGGLSLGKDTLYLSASDDSIWAFDESNGQTRWVYKRPTVKSNILWSLRGGVIPILDSKNQKLFAGFSDGVVICLDSMTGQTLWERNFARPGRFNDADQKMTLIEDLGIVLVPLVDGELVALKLVDGGTLWSLAEAGGATPFRSKSNDNHLFIGSVKGVFELIDLKTTKALWSVDLGVGVLSEATEINSQLVAVVHSERGLLVVSTKTGEVVYEFRMGPGNLSSPVYENGRLLVLSPRNKLHTFKVQTTQGS
jgi:outer membrane protein assembly factor BamB